jgi:hypothetical protein
MLFNSINYAASNGIMKVDEKTGSIPKKVNEIQNHLL